MAPNDLTARQREILALASRLLARDGLEGLTMGRVAGALGVRTPSLYKHFENKAALEAHLIAAGFEEFAEALEGAEGDLGRIASAYRSFALAKPQLYRLMTERPLPRERLPSGLEQRAAAPLVNTIGDANRSRAMWAFAHGMVQLELAGRFPAGADLDEAWRQGVIAFAGVLA